MIREPSANRSAGPRSQDVSEEFEILAATEASVRARGRILAPYPPNGGNTNAAVRPARSFARARAGRAATERSRGSARASGDHFVAPADRRVHPGPFSFDEWSGSQDPDLSDHRCARDISPTVPTFSLEKIIVYERLRISFPRRINEIFTRTKY
jgi:hypothetical protein